MRRRPHDFIALCDRYHLLPLFLNEMEELKSIDIGDGQNLFDHTIATLEIGQQFLASRKRRENDMAFSLAMLFHHAGSILSQPTDTKKAADIAARYLRAWNIGSEISGLVSIVVQNYRLPYEAITEERLCELILKEGYEAVEMILDFAICNAQADDMRNMEILAANKWKLGEVARRFEEARRCAEGNPRYLTGDEVMKILDIKSGRVVGEILNELGMAVGLGTISSKKEAKDWVVRRGTGASQ
jgi:tRNA nucleotidyltransferase/poly(A) polymerase